MANLITKFKYYKPKSAKHKGNYVKYVATREGVEKIPKKCVLLAEEKRPLIKINNTPVDAFDVWEYERSTFKYDIAPYVKTGVNEIIIELDYYQSEDVYYALFGENVTESLKNCLAYDTNIEPVYLMGDFGVYGEFTMGHSDYILLGNN